MEKTQVFNKEIIFEYKPSLETMELAILLTEKLGKLNVRLKDIFIAPKRVSRLFAFIESKYSSKIEGIYTTLFDVVNTGKETNQQQLIKPIVSELFDNNGNITKERLLKLEDIMNSGVSKSSRWEDNFGIYSTKNDIKTKVYQPPMDKNEVDALLYEIIKKSSIDDNIVKMIHTHIMFEKVHPFVDANGRLGRLIFQRSLAKLLNFSSVLPVSHSIFSNLHDYYSSFDINSKEDLDKSVQKILNVILKMYENTKKFTIELVGWQKKNLSFVKSISNKITDVMAYDILNSLQTKVSYFVKEYGINRKTVDSIFDKLNNELPFNRKIVNKKIAYWNIELESLIDAYYG